MMHGYGAKPYVDPLVREAREAENRRQRLEDRKARVFDEKARTMGVDTKALEKQVAERREREMQEKMDDQNSANQALSFAETAKQLEGLKQQNLRLERIKLAEEHARQAAEKAAREKSLREMEQKAEAQHLSAPLMVFVGEDTEKAARDKQHQELQKAWVEQQVEEKQRLEALDKQLQQEYEAKVMEMERIAQELNQSVTQRRAQDRVELREIQRQQAELKALMAKQKKELEDAMAQQEIQNMLTSPMLTENPSTTLRVDNPNRHVPYHFKGFSQEQRQQILDTQYQQLMDKAEREQKEKEEHERHEREQEEIRRLAIKTHMQVQRQKSEEAVQLRQEQLQQKAEKDARYTYINKVVYTNPVQETYFQQFGTSAR